MKISYRKVTAATETAKIPAPFDKYYRIISDEEFKEMTGDDDTSSIVEDIPGYTVKHLAWVAPKPEYDEALSNEGLWIMELVEDGDRTFIGYVVGDRVYMLDMSDIYNAGVVDEEEEY